jgi:hypothetical protein
MRLKPTMSQLVFKNSGGVINERELDDLIQSIDYLFARGKNPDVQEEDKQDVLAFLATKAIKNNKKIREFNK